MVKTFLKIFRWDWVLLQRNQLMGLSLLAGATYLGIFYLLKPLGNLNDLLVVLLLNDPVVTGFLFGGYCFLFEKNQNTLSVLALMPLPMSYPLLSKTLALTLLSTGGGLFDDLGGSRILFQLLSF
ncbi:MAG: hypothetical protein HC880_17895 [Bacteroidia bacterium]|nr:hypothetical protein [Bacteroidia bacterium]